MSAKQQAREQARARPRHNRSCVSLQPLIFAHENVIMKDSLMLLKGQLAWRTELVYGSEEVKDSR